MSDKPTSEEIINEIAEELASKKQESISDTESNQDAKIDTPKKDIDCALEFLPESSQTTSQPSKKVGLFEKFMNIFKKEEKTKSENTESICVSFDDLKKKRGIQNLQERSNLLNILKGLFKIQLIFMNSIVALIVIWVVFKCKYFNEVDREIIELLVSFVKSYIAVVLAELLGGIIYVTHKVFSEKFSDNLSK